MSKGKNRLKLKFAVWTICFIHFVIASLAASTTPSFATQIAVVASRTVDSASTRDVGAQGALAANLDQASTIQIQCSGQR